MKNKILLLTLITIASISFNFLLFLKFIVPNIIKGPTSAAIQRVEKNVIESDANDKLFEEINPVGGFQIKAKYGILGPQMIKTGVIDLKKFKETYEKSGSPLTDEQLNILTRGSDEMISINRENSYFLLNFFWAVGLNNKSKVLDEGEMTKYGGRSDLGNFASTGGWSLAQSEAMDYYSNTNLISLNKQQQELVSKIAGNIYRPCCNNSTAFPDCNHGMALLGVLELMAANGNTEDEMYQAAKYFNAYWFPGNYYDLALFFKNNFGKKFEDVDAKLILSKEFSSASGWQAAKKWLISKGLQQEPPKQSGGCGV